MRRFSFHKRGEIFYAQVLNPETGRYGSAKSTGCKDREEAVLVAARWLSEGLPVGRKRGKRPPAEAWGRDAILAAIRGKGFSAEDAEAVLEGLRERGFLEGYTLKGSPGAEKAVDFLRRFWDEDESPYLRDEKARGAPITLRHIREMARITERYWAEVLGDRLLGELSRQDVKAGIAALSARGLAAGTVAKAFACLATATKWATAEGIIPENPATEVKKIVVRSKARGILEDEELRRLVAEPSLWKDERARVAFLVAATTGLRRGEVVALRVEDVAEDRLRVLHAWNDDDGLKAPKNGEAREAVLLPEVRAALLALAATNPHRRGAEGFIFWGAEPDRPLDAQILSRGFDEALVALELGEKAARASEEERAAARKAVKARGLTFHSLRHGFATAMARRLNMEVAKVATGHLSGEMLKLYAAHKLEKDFAEAQGAAEEAFGNIVAFRRQEGAEPEAPQAARGQS